MTTYVPKAMYNFNGLLGLLTMDPADVITALSIDLASMSGTNAAEKSASAAVYV